MNYYERHIGDYLKDTVHLSLLEHGVYGRLLDVYYTREAAIPAAQVERLVGVRSKEDKAALVAVLEEFFALDGDVYRHARCDREIERYQEKQRKASASASARWGKGKSHDKQDANAMRTHSERSAKASRTHMQTQCEGNAPNHQTPDTSNQGALVEHQQHGSIDGGPVGPARADSAKPEGQNSPAQAAAVAMREAGLTDASGTHPKLVALLEAGITQGELVEAARAAVQGGKGFPWALARAEGQRRDAAQVGALPDAAPTVDPDSRAAIEADGVRFGLGKWEPLDKDGRSVQWPAYAAKVKAQRAAERGEVTA